MRQSCIYIIRSKVHPEKIYIGSTVDLPQRIAVHKSAIKLKKNKNMKLQNHVRKYGFEDFSFSILEDVADVSKLLEREQYYLDTLQPSFNICKVAGNTLGVRPSEESRKKHSLSKMGNKSNSGRKLSEEHKANIGKAGKGRKLTEEHKRKLALSKIGRKRTEAEKESMRGIKKSDECKRKLSEFRKSYWRNKKLLQTTPTKN